MTTSAKASKWGYQTLMQPPGVKLHEWFKLGSVDPGLQSTEAAMLSVKPGEWEKLVVDYLRSLKEASDSYVTRTLPEWIQGQGAPPREYIITVPAMWSEAAQEATRGCAAEAFLGDRQRINEIHIVAEPEAAAIYALTRMPTIDRKEGNTFVICDAGGG
jgi:molecular chaperone DnaK (HSP70)